MPIFKDVSDSFWDFVSPRRTRRRASTVDLPQQQSKMQRNARYSPSVSHPHCPPFTITSVEDWPERESMSPGAIVAHWRAENPSDCDSTMQEDDLEVPRSFSGADVVMEEDIEATPFDEGVDANEDTTVVEEHAYDSHQHQLDVAAQQEEADLHAERLREAGWNEDGIAVHRKIIMRGYEPLMPSHWHLDFPTIPSALFTADDDLSFINTTKGNDFRATHALNKLMELGPRVRDSSGKEETLKRAILKYIHWTKTDSKLAQNELIPIVAIVANTRQHIEESWLSRAEARLLTTLKVLARRYEDALRRRTSSSISPPSRSSNIEHGYDYARPLPTLYGIIISSTVVAFWAYNPNQADAHVHGLAIFDFSNPVYDVWNSFAIAILVVHIRNVLLDLRGDVNLRVTEHVLRQEEEDPDL